MFFNNGEYISYEWYFTTGQREQLFDYTRHLVGQEHSWYMAEYNKKGELKFEGYFGKGQYG